ncbi:MULTISPECIES: 3-phosphoglycerate dehydrogenase [Butyricimonas]|jgi:phosphoglycerate dehydrogenase|uniref:D-3-phosphoglycerate dehydrogenase n=1 Tax=Butyricimonas faecihominis TaxID=1472416 RepID=A0A7W6HZZ3_9BACT|nr:MULTISPECIES: 3-phosphoglycerate dehydrogenase [Butyricimonas]MBS6687945.1 3-phosphoglycerate dehydrogenase [Sanguibacteroides justesenii]KAB1503246.1 3-phosphoglycerate dehydrogenase [Butyricimonas faecihominis]MBB4028091.1 D-3-phosphoglycerate dehydrogenase [Butyricimonas faecihominis]WOF08955.1 3-phosphoglycerate dehydrogenase [Butyricimonas faecihominis]BEI58807.1 NAD(P)-dependent oxidoreductase [Butyricimonas faecihominis]
MTKVLIATDKPFAPVAVNGIREIVEAQGYELVLLEKYTSQDELIAAVADVDAMIIRSDKATKEVIEAAKNLKVIVRAGAGYDNIDLAACTAHNVVAMNTPGQNSNAVAELAFGMMVYMARNFFNGKSGSELKGKKIGIHAYGNVGQNVGRIARGFGMEVYAFDPFMTDEQIKNAGAIPLHSAEEMYKMCQYISLHIPATEQTKKSINYDLLKDMPKGAVLVNTARKEVIDEEGLAKLMEERADFHYITDIAPDCDCFSKFEGRFFATPKKMGAQTEEANVNAGLAAAHQIVNFIEKGDEKFRVNK